MGPKRLWPRWRHLEYDGIDGCGSYELTRQTGSFIRTFHCVLAQVMSHVCFSLCFTKNKLRIFDITIVSSTMPL